LDEDLKPWFIFVPLPLPGE